MVIKTIRDLCNLRNEHQNLFVNILTTVSNRNDKEIEPLFKFVKENLNIDRHFFHPITGNPMDKSITPLNGSDWIKLSYKLDTYKQYYVRKKLSKIAAFLFLLGVRCATKVTAQSLDGKKWPFDCRAGQNVGVLEPEGSIKLCVLTEKVGNVRDADYDFKKVWRTPEAMKIRERISARECTKGCTHGCFLNPSFMSSPLNLFKNYSSIIKKV